MTRRRTSSSGADRLELETRNRPDPPPDTSGMPSKQLVLLVEDNELTAARIRELIVPQLGTACDIVVAETLSDGLHELRERPRIAAFIVDWMLRDVSCEPLLERIGLLYPHTPRWLHTAYADDHPVCHKARSYGFRILEKGLDRDWTEICMQITANATRLRSVDARLQAEAAADPPSEPLTPRELFVVHAFIDGVTVRTTADALGIKVRQVQHHLREATAKLGLGSNNELHAFAGVG